MLKLVLQLPLQQHLPVKLLLDFHLHPEVHLLLLKMLLELILNVVPCQFDYLRLARHDAGFDVTHICCGRASQLWATFLGTLLHQEPIFLQMRLDILPGWRTLTLAVHQLRNRLPSQAHGTKRA